MNKIKKKIIQDMLVKLGLGIKPINDFMQRIEDVMDTEYLSLGGVSNAFDGWYSDLSDDQTFEVVKTDTSFSVRLCVEYETKEEK
jgi:hypothetical protein